MIFVLRLLEDVVEAGAQVAQGSLGLIMLPSRLREKSQTYLLLGIALVAFEGGLLILLLGSEAQTIRVKLRRLKVTRVRRNLCHGS